MELEYTSEGIIFNKELNELDEFVLKFTSILDEQGIRYCLISGYRGFQCVYHSTETTG